MRSQADQPNPQHWECSDCGSRYNAVEADFLDFTCCDQPMALVTDHPRVEFGAVDFTPQQRRIQHLMTSNRGIM